MARKRMHEKYGYEHMSKCLLDSTMYNEGLWIVPMKLTHTYPLLSDIDLSMSRLAERKVAPSTLGNSRRSQILQGRPVAV
jgi:hypothetical protein